MSITLTELRKARVMITPRLPALSLWPQAGFRRAVCLSLRSGAILLWLLLGTSGLGADSTGPWLTVPATAEPVQMAIRLPESLQVPLRGPVSLTARDGRSVPATVMPGPAEDGSADRGGTCLVVQIPPAKPADGRLQFQVKPETGSELESPEFVYRALNDKSLGLWEGERPVLVYNHGIMSREGVPADRNRSTYLHPLYGLEGEVLTDDFPKDHYHHRGLFWAWPHVIVGDREFSLWDIRGVHQRFERWLARETGSVAAVLGIENGWYVGDRKVMQERVWLRVYRSSADARVMDVELFWVPVGEPVTLRGAEGKSYGGLTLRFAPRPTSTITTPLGAGPEDLTMTSLPWADLSAQFTGATQPSGAAIFIHPDHPDYPPTWLTRHYGVLCVGWPGVRGLVFPAGEPFSCRYRVWIHRGDADVATLKRHYAAYTAGTRVDWE